ncbi:MAG: MarR family winged helix-turn-helix transcriptional regulator [Actinomycetota bacterium]|nr:MarR family winged helix-turn-helix transcriptional regulator [Actinomycetota bacterium]
MVEEPRFIATPGLLRRAYNALSARLFTGVVVAGFEDLRPAHGNVLEHLSERPPEALRLVDLAARAGMTPQSMGELVDDLEARGYVERRPDPADRRAKRVHLTDKGLACARAAERSMREVERQLVAALGDAEYRRLRAALEQVLDARPAPDRAPNGQ